MTFSAALQPMMQFPLGSRANVADWWTVAGYTCVAAYQPKSAASLAASYVNLANPGSNLAVITAPTMGASGWDCDGTAALDTGIVPGLDYTHVVRVENVSGGAQGIFSSNTERRYVYHNFSGFRIFANGASSALVLSGGYANGVFAIAGNKAYLNGSQESGTIPRTISAFTKTMHVGSLRTDGYTGINGLVGTIVAYAMYSTTLSAGDVAALTTRMQAL